MTDRLRPELAVSVVVIFRGRDPHRLRALERVLAWYRQVLPAAEVVVVDDVEPFEIAPARNEGVRRATGDILFLADADSLVSRSQAIAAVQAAADATSIVIAHDRFLYLDRRMTNRMLRARTYDRRLAFAGGCCEDMGKHGVSQAVVFHRSVYDAVGGWDRRFRGWGCEDAAFALACNTIVGPLRRIPGDVYHFWHPVAGRGRIDNGRSLKLLRRYQRAADTGPTAMRRLLSERGGPLHARKLADAAAAR